MSQAKVHYGICRSACILFSKSENSEQPAQSDLSLSLSINHSVLQKRGDNRDNLGILVHLFAQKDDMTCH